METTKKYFDMTGRAVLITGASSGLGRRFAKVMARAGARVAIAARREDLLHELAVEIAAAGAEALPITMDVSDEASVVAGFKAAERRFGPIESVIANAGMNSEGMTTDISADEFDRVFDVNVKGAFLTAREGAKRMMAAGSKDSGRGRIVLVASIGAFNVLPGLGAYCASKAAVLQLGKVMAREWANRGININILCPGYIETELNADWFATEGGKRQVEGFPRRRLMAESDLDILIAYLVSDEARAITGSVFTLDDGQSL